MISSNWENLIIYCENLSSFYIICALVSFLAVYLTWNMRPKTLDTVSNLNIEQTQTSESESDEDDADDVDEEASEEEMRGDSSDGNDYLRSGDEELTEYERRREMEIAREQLVEVLELMKTDKNFRAMTMEELEEQLKLYRK